MLVPLTREAFEAVIPLVATAQQYRYYWGQSADLIKRLLISVIGVVAVLLLKGIFFRQGWDVLLLPLGITAGLYWFWAPVWWASRWNLACRRFSYAGFWQGEVVEVYTTEELVSTEETVNPQGELVIVENRERWVNLKVTDDQAFSTTVQAPLQRQYQVIRPGDLAQMLCFSNRSDLSRIAKVSDLFLPDHNLWVSDYPYLRRDAFEEIAARLSRSGDRPRSRGQINARTSKRPRRSGQPKRTRRPH